MVILTIQPITLSFHMVHDMLIEQRFYLQIQHHMRMLVLIIRPHMLLIIMSELMKFKQGIQMLILMIRLHVLLAIIAESMKIQHHMQELPPHTSALYLTRNRSRISEIAASYGSISALDSASHGTNKYSSSNENSENLHER